MREATFAEEIRERRLRLGLSQAELARRIGVHAQTVRAWERGASYPRESLRVRLLEVLEELESGLPSGLRDKVQKDDLGQEIRRRRLRLCMTQDELARRVGVNVRTVRAWERGRAFPRRGQLLSLFEILSELERERGLPSELDSDEELWCVELWSSGVRKAVLAKTPEEAAERFVRAAFSEPVKVRRVFGLDGGPGIFEVLPVEGSQEQPYLMFNVVRFEDGNKSIRKLVYRYAAQLGRAR